ncbi:hypothetical protein [Methylicorpusculum sp.]|uniref:hypothetical protein n=1 Tax=Methylicorpusculum sp. TaxID=2713644 RepID=UPI00273097E4|nr:hypothetical protein [Methylicorpusculum sp.]MDP3527836.1 hypothetical protein [Methylicorpusculum sp.]MDZ4151571.1 hypothetical protein [Methylicorpusculum sp.]
MTRNVFGLINEDVEAGKIKRPGLPCVNNRKSGRQFLKEWDWRYQALFDRTGNRDFQDAVWIVDLAQAIIHAKPDFVYCAGHFLLT